MFQPQHSTLETLFQNCPKMHQFPHVIFRNWFLLKQTNLMPLLRFLFLLPIDISLIFSLLVLTINIYIRHFVFVPFIKLFCNCQILVKTGNIEITDPTIFWTGNRQFLFRIERSRLFMSVFVLLFYILYLLPVC